MGDPHGVALALPPRPESAGRARRFLRERLDDLGLDELGDAATLLVSEVVTNVVLHAHTTMQVRVTATAGGVRVDVLDGSPARPAHREYDGYASTGHGLTLVADLADAYGVEVRPDGKNVWFTLDTSPGAVSRRGGAAADWAVTGGEPPPPGASTPVLLQGLPVRLWAAARQHHEAALRELYLQRALRGAEQGPVAPAGAQESLSVLDLALETAVARGAGDADRVDVDLLATDELVGGVLALQAALDEAERLARDGHLLVLPALPEVIAVRDWVCEQVVAQVGGVAPLPWARHRVPPGDDGCVPVAGWDPAPVHGSTRPVVAGDDSNRVLAVSPPAADLLGWDVDDLIGRRVVDLVPESLREAHVVGFTRHLTTGEGHVLGRRLDLPVLRSDGTEVRVWFLLERVPAERGRTVYLAWLDPLPGS